MSATAQQHHRTVQLAAAPSATSSAPLSASLQRRSTTGPRSSTGWPRVMVVRRSRSIRVADYLAEGAAAPSSRLGCVASEAGVTGKNPVWRRSRAPGRAAAPASRSPVIAAGVALLLVLLLSPVLLVVVLLAVPIVWVILKARSSGS